MTPEQLAAIQRAQASLGVSAGLSPAQKAAIDRAMSSISSGGDGPQVPEGMFLNPVTGQMTSRDMLANNMAPGPKSSAAFGAMQGLGFGLGDELMGGVGYLTGGPDMANYKREQARAYQEAAQADHGGAYLAGNIGGAIGTGLATGGVANAALGGAPMTMTGQALTGAGLGAAEGFLAGFGEGEGGLYGRAVGALDDMALGAAIGGIAPAAVQGAKKVGGVLSGAYRGITNSPDTVQASRYVMDTMNRADLDPARIQAYLDDAAAAGQPAAIADAMGYEGARSLAGITRSTSDARKAIADALIDRQGGQARRVSAALEEALNVNATAKQTETALESAKKALADFEYEDAIKNAGNVDLTGVLGKIDEVLDRDNLIPSLSGGDAVALSRSAVGERLAGLRRRMATDNGAQSMDFERILRIKQDIYAGTNGLRNAPPDLREVYGLLDSALEQASPSYRAANDNYRTASKVIEQVEAGKKAHGGGVRAEDVIETYSNLSPDEAAAFRAGYGDRVINQFQNYGAGADATRKLTATGSVDELGAMAKDPAALQSFIARERDMHETAHKSLGGSLTADHSEDVKAASNFDLSLITNLLGGRIGTAATQAGLGLLNAASGRNTSTRSEIARLLMSQNIEEALAPAQAAALKDANLMTILNSIARGGARPTYEENE